MIENTRAETVKALAADLELAAKGLDREAESLGGASKAFGAARDQSIGSVFTAITADLAAGKVSEDEASAVRRYLVKASHALGNAQSQALASKLSVLGQAAGLRDAAKRARRQAEAFETQAALVTLRMETEGVTEEDARRPRSAESVRADLKGRSSPGPATDTPRIAKKSKRRPRKKAPAQP